MTNMHSRIYVGQVSHRRFSPRSHAFNYRLFMLYLDLDELPGLFDRFLLWSARGFNFAWFNRKDHLGDKQQSLSDSVRNTVLEETGHYPNGPIRLLTHLRYLGYGFNPVSFYYCFNAEDTSVEYVVAEVNNTPWGEQHVYVYSAPTTADKTRKLVFSSSKQFHVSPFMPMDMTYHWRLATPGEKLAVHIENHRNNQKVFDATLAMKARPINARTLNSALMRFPLMTARVVFLIYFEALRLWLKKVPIHHHSKPQEALIKGKSS